MLVIGFCCIPVLLFWELKAKHPLIPFRVSAMNVSDVEGLLMVL